MADIKFCGLTRATDATQAARLGARYVGVIFAGGPRLLDADAAAAVLGGVPEGVTRVGVFGEAPPEQIARVARSVGLQAAQLHSDPAANDVAAVRERFGGEVWAVVRTADASLPAGVDALFAAADAVVLDAKVAGALGGTGVRLPWAELAAPLAAARRGHGRRARLVLAGGLTPDNVAAAIAALSPDVVDVSSGVEASVGVKDHARMRAFAHAVRGASADAPRVPRDDVASTASTRSSNG